MTFEDFQHLARLYIVGALDDAEMEQFCIGRTLFKAPAEAYIRECRKLNSVFALSLRPMAASPDVKAKLMDLIKKTPQSSSTFQPPPVSRPRENPPLAMAPVRR